MEKETQKTAKDYLNSLKEETRNLLTSQETVSSIQKIVQEFQIPLNKASLYEMEVWEVIVGSKRAGDFVRNLEIIFQNNEIARNVAIVTDDMILKPIKQKILEKERDSLEGALPKEEKGNKAKDQQN